MKIVYANAPVPGGLEADVLLTDEALVADAWEGRARVLDEQIDAAVAQEWSARMWDLAFSWFLDGEGHDPTHVAGISAGDLGAFEAALTVLLPAARAVLGVQAAAADLMGADELVLVLPRSGAGNHDTIEAVAAECAATALAPKRLIRVEAAQDERLLAKYRRTRDPDWLARGHAGRRILRSALLAAVNLRFHLRKRPSLFVYEYSPTRAFAREYASDPDRTLGLVRAHAEPRDLFAIARVGDRAADVVEPFLRGPCAVASIEPKSIDIAGLDVRRAVSEPLLTILERYGRFASEAAEELRRKLQRSRVRAVLVPFDGVPSARLLVRVAQQLAIPTFVLNDGFKADDLGREGMTADVALTWSELMRDSYFRRRPDGTATVTGNPRASRLPLVSTAQSPYQHVLVGGFTYSPMDLNCRRSDVERFTAAVLDGVAAGLPAAAVTLKLHPADEPGHYGPLLTRHPHVEVVAQGDVLDLFASAHVYVSTYTTSLIEAAVAGLPVVYYRVNEQRIGPPFDGDPWLTRRTASTPEQLAALLQDPDLLRQAPPPGWSEHVLGPRDGRASERIFDAINSAL